MKEYNCPHCGCDDEDYLKGECCPDNKMDYDDEYGDFLYHARRDEEMYEDNIDYGAEEID